MNQTGTTEDIDRKRRKGKLLERGEYLLYRAAASLVLRATDETILRWGARLGRITSRLLPGRNNLALRNLVRVFPEKSESDRKTIARRCWEHFGRVTLEYLRAQSRPASAAGEVFDVIGRERLDQAVALRRGVFLVTAHYGTWEIGLRYLTSFDYEISAVARPLDNELLEEALSESRGSEGVELIDKRSAARALVRALERGRVIVLLPDQAVLPREGILTPFLGHPAWTTPAPARLSLRYGAAIVFVFSIPHGTRHDLIFEGPILMDELDANQKNVEAVTARINEVIGRRILERPELWLWMHDRWKGVAP